MTRFTDRVTRDLHQIADRSTPSSTAWESIRTRIDKQPDQPTMEVIMLSPDRTTEPKRGWMMAAAAVAALVVGGLVFAMTRSGDDVAPADTATLPLPTAPAPDTTIGAPATTAAPEATDPAEDAVSEPIVVEGGYVAIHTPVELPGGLTYGMWMDGDTSGQVPDTDMLGQGAFFGTITTTGGQITGGEGSWVIRLSVPDVGEGLLLVQGWNPVRTPTSFDGAGTVVGLSGDFTDMTGTFSTTVFEQNLDSLNAGTWAFELQPGQPAPDPAEPTETRTIEYQGDSVGTFLSGPDFQGGITLTGDIVGSGGFVGNTAYGAVEINVGTLDGEEGVFITTRGPLTGAEPWTVEAEFYGVSGAFEGFTGTGTATGTTFDETGAFTLSASRTFEVSR